MIRTGVSFKEYVPEALRFYSSLDWLKFVHVIMSDLAIKKIEMQFSRGFLKQVRDT